MSPVSSMVELEEKMRRGENRFELWIPQNRTHELGLIMNHFPSYNHTLRSGSKDDSTLVIFSKK